MGLILKNFAYSTLQHIVPLIFSILLFCGGAMLLVSAALPIVPENLKWISQFEPLTFIELSHIVSVLSGLFLLFLARGVRLRLDAAYYACIAALIAAIIALTLKGLEWKQAMMLGAMLLLFIPTRKYFNRKASLFTMQFPPEWIALIALVLALATWLGFETYKHVEYAHDLWWRFSYREDAPRFLRMVLVTGAFIFAYALYNIFKVARPALSPALSAADRARLYTIAHASNDCTSFLSLMGDKAVLWSDSGKAFIMYAMTPRYWVAMGDPVGDAAEFPALLWKFRENADLHNALAVYYQVSDRHLPLYLDRGLILLKMGEEARIFLPTFHTDGGKRENQRKLRNRMHRDGYSLHIIEGAELDAALPALRVISDSWLATKKVKEKGFSLGFFDESYIRSTRVAVVKKDGRIYAFANIWDLQNHEQISLDLMRYDPEDSPPGMMEYLFLDTIFWAKDQGYQWFGLGMSPLSGMEEHALAPLWHKIGRTIYKHGEDLYNFEGLRAYKSKFDPVWRPRYMAVPPTPRIPMVLLAVARIISGGFRGMFKKR
ncbi:bifunctional lysylphosphatidylglycerol flippase/synthetase MprF [Micavibrio aeruginosavorus]|uniref:bifunctional lysylphosphatidylglycerol flippase/synthetase MprF n=1 Tax=Micavibrio aeruginosavorus TaxID=349221 RepID=UPI003F4ADDF1